MNCLQKKIFIVISLVCIIMDSNTYAQTCKLVYSTYLGGSQNDGFNNWLNEFAVDDSGNIIFTADTESSDFPVTENAYDKTYNGGNDWGAEDNIIIKFDIYEKKLNYSSYFGGKNGPDFVEQVYVHGNDFFLAGNSGSSDYPTTADAYDRIFNGPVFRHADGVISKFQNNQLIYSTFLGTSGNETMSKILLDANDCMIAVGQVAKPNELPFLNKFSEDTLSENPKGCVIRFNTSADSIIFSTILGPVWEIDAVIDENDYIYIAGTTPSSNFPVTDEAYDHSYNGGDKTDGGDIFVMKLTPQGDQILFSTYLGGSSNEFNPRIRLDRSNNVIVYGRTASNDFPLTNDAFDKIFSGGSELFIAKLSDDGKSLLYSSYFGGTEKSQYGEQNTSIVMSEKGDVYLNGLTDADDHPVTQNALNNTNNGGKDIFITVLDCTLKNIRYSTYIGGKADEVCSAIALDFKQNIICVGATQSSDFPITADAHDSTSNGGCDITLSILSPVDSIQTGIKIKSKAPEDFQLNQNYPNPFNPSTTIKYSLAKSSQINLTISNLLGQKIKTLVSCFKSAGEHSVVWDATDDKSLQVSTGIYFYKLGTNEMSIQKKMILIR